MVNKSAYYHHLNVIIGDMKNKNLHIVLEAKEVTPVNIRRQQLQAYTGAQEET